MRVFEFAFGIGNDETSAEATSRLRALRKDLTPRYLLSCEKIKLNHDLTSKLSMSRSVISSSVLWDSAGYSFLKGGMHVMRLPVEEIVEIYHQWKFQICMSTDIPLFNLDFERNLAANKVRIGRFYSLLEKPEGVLVYDPIHGDLFDHSGTFCTEEKDQWLDMLRSLPGHCADGAAIKILAKDPAQIIVNLLYPLARGLNKVHLLGLGKLEWLGFYVYASHALGFEKVTADATNYTIKAVSDVIWMHRRQNLPPTFVNFKEAKYKAEKLDAPCSCEACVYYEQKFRVSVRTLVEKNHNGEAFDNNERLYQWICTHNILVVQEYLEFLYEIGGDRDRMLSHLEDAGYKSAATGIRLLDSIVPFEPKRYSSNLVRMLRRDASRI